MVSNVKKKSKLERFGNLKPREESQNMSTNHNMSRNFVVITKSNSPTNNENDSIFNQTGG